jgi:K+ transporter
MDTDPRLKQSRAALTIAALGIVYGDIGTSPLYAVKETFAPGHGIPLESSTILGGISAILWALMLVVSLKYVVLIMRAHNKSEGGIMALHALAASAGTTRAGIRWSCSPACSGRRCSTAMPCSRRQFPCFPLSKGWKLEPPDSSLIFCRLRLAC